MKGSFLNASVISMQFFLFSFECWENRKSQHRFDIFPKKGTHFCFC